MYIYEPPKPYPGEPWGFDNGAFKDWCDKVPFNEKRYMQALERARNAPTPYLAVVPDLVGRGAESLNFSLRWIAKQSLYPDWPWYLALQDGMTQEDVRPIVGLFAGLFLGGTDAFKKTAAEWCEFAHAHGLKFHYARAGTERKIRHAITIGADSLDSSFPLWTLDRIRRMEYLTQEWRQREPALHF